MSEILTLKSIRQGNDYTISDTVMNFLADVFPGYKWAAMTDQGITKILNLSLSGKWGVQLHTNKLSKKLLIDSCGELLDRFGAPSKYDITKVRDLKVDFTGDIKSEKWTPDRRYYNKAEKRWKA